MMMKNDDDGDGDAAAADDDDEDEDEEDDDWHKDQLYFHVLQHLPEQSKAMHWQKTKQFN